LNNSSSDIIVQKKDKLLSVIQSDFPIVSRPFKVIAARIGLTEREVINSISSLMDEGTIRAFGPVFEARRLGYVSTLIAAKVSNERVTELAAAMLDINEITHNYLRDNEFNLWFTITALNSDVMDKIIKWIKNFPDVNKVINLPAKKVLKINAVWGTGVSKTTNIDYETETPPLAETGKNLVKALQNEFPIVENPFRVIANSTGADEPELLETINSWLDNGTIRRFGARLSHKKIGYTHNILAAWEGKDSELWGDKFAEFTQVSHCYLREPHDDWPYELYTMIHAKSDIEANEILKTMKSIARGAKMVAMKTLYELKKTSMKYFMEE